MDISNKRSDDDNNDDDEKDIIIAIDSIGTKVTNRGLDGFNNRIGI